MSNVVSLVKDVPVVDHADVVVVGAGPAGFGAALAAARAGTSTILVERYGFLGGNSTASLVGPFMTSFSYDGENQIIRGIFDELVRRMEAAGGAIHPSKVRKGSGYSGHRYHGHDHVTPFDPETMKYISEEMAVESGVRLILHAYFVDPLKKGDTVAGIIYAGKSGLEAVRGSVVVDCTGDADVAHRAGAPTVIGRPSDGLTQPATLFFRMYNIDDDAIQAYIDSDPRTDERPFGNIVDKAKDKGKWIWQRSKIAMYKTPAQGVWRFNITRIQGLDFLDTADLTRAELAGRRQVMKLVDFLKANVPGFADAKLMDTAAQVGVRETRRIVGEYTLTLDDLASGGAFEDVIALGSYPVDIHDPTGWGGGCTDEYPTANIYEIPLRILVPLEVDGLLVAGRCVSAQHEALGAIRTMPSSMAMGQAAGVAAALAARSGARPREVPVAELQRGLLSQDVYLGEELPPLLRSHR